MPETKPGTPETSLAIGVLAAAGVICIWSSFFVLSRSGVLSALTPYDLTALRFMVAGALVIPFARRWWPRHLPLHAQALMAATGPGLVYTMLMYQGLSEAPVAYGGVFANGSLPIFTTLVTFLVTGIRPGPRQILALSAIVAGAVLLGLPGVAAAWPEGLLGVGLFLAASAILSVYMFGLRHWRLAPTEALMLVNLPNAILYLPLWWLWLPSGLDATPTETIVLQALFQGFGPGFFAVIMFALTAKHLGPIPTAGVSASAPASATLLAIPTLGEIPSPMEWAGIVVVTLGLALLMMWRDRPTAAARDRARGASV